MKLTKRIKDTFDTLINYLKNNQIMVLIIIILINLFLKTMFIDESSYWLDEGSQLHMSKNTIGGIINHSLQDPNAPVYTLLLKVWMKFFGFSEFSTRFLSLMFHLISVVVLFLFSRRFFNFKIALITILLFTFSNLNTYYAQEARSYTLIVLLTITSFYFLFSLVEKFKYRDLIFFTLTNTLLIFTHLTPILVFPVQFLFAILHWKINRKSFVFIFSSQIFTVFLLFIWLMNNKWFGGNETTWMQVPNLKRFYNVLAYFLNNKIVVIALIPLIIIFLINLIKNFKSEKTSYPKYLTTFLWAFFPIIVTYLASIYYNPRFHPRYMIYASIGMYLLVAILIEAISKKNSIYIALTLLLTVIFTANIKINFQKDEDWKNAVAYVKSLQNQQTAIILCPEYMDLVFEYYFMNQINPDYNTRKSELKSKNVFTFNSDQAVSSIDFSKYDECLIIYGQQQYSDPDLKLANSVKGKLMLVKIKEFYNVKIYYFKKAPKVEPEIYNFDYESNAISPKIIESKNAHSGKKVAIVNSDIEYSETYLQNIKEIKDKNFNLIKAKAWIFSKETTTDAKFVLSIDNNSGSKVWIGKEIDKECKTNVWSEIEVITEIPSDIPDDAILKIYLWSPRKKTLLLDDLTVEFN